jgi:hypothetical protein
VPQPTEGGAIDGAPGAIDGVPQPTEGGAIDGAPGAIDGVPEIDGEPMDAAEDDAAENGLLVDVAIDT